jgi:hypothetical protein
MQIPPSTATKKAHDRLQATPVAKGDDGNATDNAKDSYKPPVWAKFVTWPEGVGAWAVILTLLAIAWQSIETRAAAKATKASVEEGSKTAERQLRAYLCIAYSELRFLEDGTIEPVLHLKNCGITPAYKVSSWQRGRLREYPLTSPLEPAPDDLLKGVAIIPPNHHHVATCGQHTIPQFMLDSLETKKFAFYVYGEATYIDIFKRKRTLEFRLISGGPAGTRTRFDEKRKMNVGFLVMDTEGNESD